MRAWVCGVSLVAVVLTLPRGVEDGKTAPGWAGADLAQAQILARETNQPILVFARSEDCPPCDRVEERLTQNDKIVPLTRPYIRLVLSTSEPQGRAAAALLGITVTPTVLILGPEGMEAIRGEKRISTAWLAEQLQVITLRHQELASQPAPTPAALRSSLTRLLQWGDLAGAEQINGRLGAEQPQAAKQAIEALPELPEISTQAELEALLDRLDDPGEIRRTAHDLALALESQGRPGMSLAAYDHIIQRLSEDPLSEARAAFLAVRQGLPLANRLRRLETARAENPQSLALLMATARVAEEMGRLYKAYHAVEAAAVYAPEDAWITLERHRLRFLVQLKSRKLAREPT